MQESQQAPKSEWQRASQKLFKTCPHILIPDRNTTHPSLQMPLLPQTHQLQNPMHTPETDQSSLHFSPEKKTQLNALICNKKDCYRFSCSHLNLFSTPAKKPGLHRHPVYRKTKSECFTDSFQALQGVMGYN